MDFSFSFMQGIMGNTIQQPPQLIDSANIRQEGAYDTGSDAGEDGAPSYDAALEAEFSYPPSASEDMPPVSNGYPPGLGLYEPQAKFSMYPQFPNGSANGYGAIRGNGPEGPCPPGEIPLPYISSTFTPPPPPSPSPPPFSSLPPSTSPTHSPEIKLKIIKTYQNGRELFESALCGDLLQESQASEASQSHRRHERKKEKRKKTLPVGQTEKPQKTPIKAEPETPKVCYPTVITGTGCCKDHEVGDLVWAKVGTYPWWPCMVSCDPQMNVHTRINTRGHREYHVQFFGSVAERAWVHEKRVVMYQGEHQFDELQAETLRKTTNTAERHKLMKPFPQRERAQWEVGVGHAEDAFLMTQQERIDNYTFIYKTPTRTAGPDPQTSEKDQSRDPGQPSPPAREALSKAGGTQESPAPVRAWKTAAARKLLPLSITMKKLNVEITKCDQHPARYVRVYARFLGLLVITGEYSVGGNVFPTEQRCLTRYLLPVGSQERKQQRRSVRSRSESEKGCEPVPKKKTKKEQVPTSSEISDACKPLKKRSRASTDVEMASSQYRDTSDSDSRGLNDPQSLFGKSLDSPAAADADESDSQSVDSSLSRQGSSTAKIDTVCQICEVYGEGLVSCEGDCCRLFHLECLGLASVPEGKFTCLECRNGSHLCFSCKAGGGEVLRCSVVGCGRYYHDDCVRKLPGTVGSGTGGGFRCPQHTCATCCLERDLHQATQGRMMRCLRCPVAYHTGDSCVAAGSMVLTHHIMICSSHGIAKRNGLLSSPVNVNWCFLCARGLLVQDLTDTILSSYAYKSHYLLTESNRAELKLPMIPSSSSATKKNMGKGNRTLLCCALCPASFHPECLEMAMPEGAWSCRECRSGRKPHYKQIVWVKLGNYRWWPAEICNPRLVPPNIQTLRHDIGAFPVFFFGSHDYYWINQGRVFPYVENDKTPVTGQININKTFKKALEEAARRFQELKAQRESREALEQERNSRKPPPYKFIKSNKPVGKVQVHIADLSEIPRCNCKPTDEHPCSLDSQCLNRMLQYECHPQVCPTGDNCENQCFSKRLYSETEVIKTDGCGWGLKTNQALRKGDFVTEYVGEVIDSEECQQRIKHAHENRVTDFYMLTLTKDRVIDAGPKGNSSRFINHSCSPNCETQKWTVNGDVRIGLFTLCDIEAGTELTFNYNLDLVGNRRSSCHCGAENCSGFLGVRPTSAVVMEKEEKARNAKLKPKKRKLRPEGRRTHEYFCFCCGEGGELVICDKKDCPKAYHLLCLNLTKPPYGRWECPWHDCSVCGVPASSLCDFCPRSFCRQHEGGVLTPSTLEGRPCCSNHNPLSPLGSNANLPHAHTHHPGTVSIKEEPEDPEEEPSQQDRE
uniref:Histone-lysine N-methyltransferase NSD3 n=1 Tax=Oncorhynchus tshawytscha TaxID=74940 RepID=A0A8C8FTW4_ONCTS